MIALKEPGNKPGHVRNVGHIVTAIPPGIAVHKVIKVPLLLVDILKPWVNIISNLIRKKALFDKLWHFRG